MSKMKDLQEALNVLRRDAKDILEIVDAVEKELCTKADDTTKKNPKQKQLFDPAPTKEETPAEPVKEITLAEIKAVLMEKSKAGFDQEVHALIKSYDAPKLSAIDKVNYPELLEKAREIGNA